MTTTITRGASPLWREDMDRPEGLRDGDECQPARGDVSLSSFLPASDWDWRGITAIRLADDHPAAKTQRYLDTHPDGLRLNAIYHWSDGHPQDWDGGKVLFADGVVARPDTANAWRSVVAYVRHPSPVEPRTGESEPVTLWREVDAQRRLYAASRWASDVLGDVLAILERRGFTEHADAPAIPEGKVLVDQMTEEEVEAFTERLADCIPNKMEMCHFSRYWDAIRWTAPAILKALNAVAPDHTPDERIAAVDPSPSKGQTMAQSKRVGDLVVRDNRMWRITGIYLGALGQEDAIGLEVVDRRPPHVGEQTIEEMIVPELLVDGFVFRASERRQ